jgi:cytochrome oxidase assembly protein ShyY1
MQAVRIEGPSFVMMSGEDGPIQVTVVNGLDQTVRVGIAAQTRSSGLKIKQHDDVTLGPGRRTAIRLEATSQDIGVHAVTLVATDSEGTPLGSLTQVSVRTSRVSTVIWVIMAAGGVLLFLAIGVRLYRRVRRRKSTHGPRLPRDRSGLPGQELNA